MGTVFGPPTADHPEGMLSGSWSIRIRFLEAVIEDVKPNLCHARSYTLMSNAPNGLPRRVTHQQVSFTGDKYTSFDELTRQLEGLCDKYLCFGELVLPTVLGFSAGASQQVLAYRT